MRAAPRNATAQPFKSHARPKWWHAAVNACIAKREQGQGRTFSAILKWHYGPRTLDEELWFGAGGGRLLAQAMAEPHPFYAMIKKEPVAA